MSESLVTINQNQEQAIQVGGLGLRGVESLKPGPMILVQPTTEVEGVSPGLFLDKLSGETWKTIKFVPLSISFPRKKYPSAKFVKGERPICQSYDGLRPVTGNPDLVPQAPNCAVCPHSKWGKNKSDRPSCGEKGNLLLIEQDSTLPFYLQVTGKSVTPVKRLQTAIERSAVMTRARNGRIVNIFDYVVTATTKKDQGSPTYIIEFIKVELMKPEDAAAFGPLYAQIMERKDALDAERVADEGAGEVIEGEAAEQI